LDRRVPLLWWLVAAWAFDITGVGHWIPFAVVLAALALQLARRRWDTRAGVLVALTLLSHDLLDLVVGVQLLPGGRYVGWDLGAGRWIELLLELGFLLIGGAVYVTTLPHTARRRPAVFVAMAALVLASLAWFTLGPSEDDEVDPDPAALLVLCVGAIGTGALLVRADRDARREDLLAGPGRVRRRGGR
jgi:hypothetical protein